MKQSKFLSLTAALVLALPLHGLSAPSLDIDLVPGGNLSFRLTESSPGEIWTLQDSYDSIHWRDLTVIGTKGVQERVSDSVPTRLFRAARNTPSTNQEALDQAVQRWTALNLRTYMYVNETENQLGPRRELVSVAEDGPIESIVLDVDSFVGDPGQGLTIGNLFTRIQDAINSDAHRIDIRYHPTFGYPESIFIDYSEFIADEEWRFAIISPPEDPLTALERNTRVWNRKGPASYQFHLEFQTAWWRWNGVIAVENGEATVLTNGKFGPPSSDHIVQRIEGYFDLVRTAIEEGHDLSVAYDETLGFPIAISDNWRWTWADGPGERYIITDLRILKPKK